MKFMATVIALTFSVPAHAIEHESLRPDAIKLLASVCKSCKLSTFEMSSHSTDGPKRRILSTCSQTSTSSVFGVKVGTGLCVKYDEAANPINLSFPSGRKISGIETYQVSIAKNKMLTPMLHKSAKGFFKQADIVAMKTDSAGKIVEWRSGKVFSICGIEFPIGTDFKVNEEDQIDFWIGDDEEVYRSGTKIAPGNPIPLGSAGMCSKDLDRIPAEGYFQ